MLRARPLAPLAAGFVAGIAIALTPGAWIPLTAAGTLADLASIRWRHPALLLVLGLGLGARRQHVADATAKPRAHADPLEGIGQGPPRIYRSLGDVEFLGPAGLGEVRPCLSSERYVDRVACCRRPLPG